MLKFILIYDKRKLISVNVNVCQKSKMSQDCQIVKLVCEALHMFMVYNYGSCNYNLKVFHLLLFN